MDLNESLSPGMEPNRGQGQLGSLPSDSVQNDVEGLGQCDENNWNLAMLCTWLLALSHRRRSAGINWLMTQTPILSQKWLCHQQNRRKRLSIRAMRRMKSETLRGIHRGGRS